MTIDCHCEGFSPKQSYIDVMRLSQGLRPLAMTKEEIVSLGFSLLAMTNKHLRLSRNDILVHLIEPGFNDG